MSEQPQEWTPEYVQSLVNKELGYGVCAKISHHVNAALAAAQERVSQAWLKAESDTIHQLREQLAAEQEKTKQLEKDLAIARPLAGRMFDENHDLRQQLATERREARQAALETDQEYQRALAAEREKVKTLVELCLKLEPLITKLSSVLAKVKKNK